MKTSPEANMMLMLTEDNSMFVLWHQPGEHSREPEALDPVTAMAYDAMMIEPEDYNPLGGEIAISNALLTPVCRVTVESLCRPDTSRPA